MTLCVATGTIVVTPGITVVCKCGLPTCPDKGRTQEPLKLIQGGKA